MSCMTSAYFGSPRGLVSYCNTYPCHLDTEEVRGSSPPGPTIVFHLANPPGNFTCKLGCAKVLFVDLPWGATLPSTPRWPSFPWIAESRTGQLKLRKTSTGMPTSHGPRMVVA